MAEKKMYITQNNEFGQVLVSEDVVATIARRALEDIDGYAGLSGRTHADFARALSDKQWRKGIRVYVSEKGYLFLEVNILVYFGTDVTEVAQKIQNKISESIFSITGHHPKRIHVNICGILQR